MVFTAQHGGDACECIIDHIREKERCRTIRSLHDEIADVRAGEHLLCMHEVRELNATLIGHPKTQRGLAAFGESSGALMNIEVAAGAGIARRTTRSELGLAADLDLKRRAVAGIHPPRLLKLREGLGIDLPSPALLDDFAIPRQTEPLQIGLQLSGVLGLAALGIGVFDAQQELPPAALGEQIVEQRRARIAEV